MICETCDGACVLVGTQHDGRGGDQDVIEPCPDCADLEAWAEHLHNRRRRRPAARLAEQIH